MSNSKIIRSPKSGKYGLQEVGDKKDLIIKKIQGVISKALQRKKVDISDKEIEKIARKIYIAVNKGI